MINRILIKGKSADCSECMLFAENGKIIKTDCRQIPENCEVLDFGDNYILPSFIEAHAHGGGGFDFIDNTEESFEAIYKEHLSHGVTYLCPTLCACDFDELIKFLNLCQRKKTHRGFIGVHLEGPFLSAEMCGAQNLSCLRDPSYEDIEKLAAYSKVISRITIAPELSGAKKLIDKMTCLGIKFSVGHSAIDAEGFKLAKETGINSVTHLYSSMKGRYKRDSYVLGGLIEAALADDDCFVELIGDGHHVSRENLLLTLKCKGADRVVLVSDAMRAAGVVSPFSHELGESFLGAVLPENRVILENGVAKLPDRSSFAGSLAIGDTMVKALVEEYGIPLNTVSYIMSCTPAKMLGISGVGMLKEGYSADITVLDNNYTTVCVIQNGEIVYNKN